MPLYRELIYRNGTLNDTMGAIGTSTGATFSQKEKGLALQTGQNQYITYNSQLLPNGAFSVVVWAKLKSSHVVGTDRATSLSSTITGSRGGVISYATSGGLSGLILNGANARYWSYIPNKTWHCYIFTIPGADQTSINSSTLKVDNVPITTSSTVSSEAQSARSGFIYTGGSNSASGGCHISLIRVYDHVLSDAEQTREYEEYLKAKPLSKPKSGLSYPKPTDLSSFTNYTIGNGALYNFYAVATGKLAPTGWHVPTDTEFTTLVNYLGGYSVAGGKLKSTRTGLTPGWNSPNTGADNSSGFNGLGSGYIDITSGYLDVRNYLETWTSIEFNSTASKTFYLSYNSNTLSTTNESKKYGFPVRCIKDDSTWYPGMTVTDIDDNVYPTVKIGNQVWIASNLKTTHYNDGEAIPNVTGNSAWVALTTGAYCTYNNAAISEYVQPFNNNGLVAAYNFIKTGTTLTDISGNGKNGTITGTVQTKEGLQFNGSGKVAFGNLGDVYSVAFRIKFKTTSEKILEKAANSGLIYTNLGALTAADFTNKYVNGVATTTITSGQWYNIVLTSASAVAFSAATLALNNTTYGLFEIADLRFYNYTLTLQQVKDYHNLFVKPVLVEDFKFDKADGNNVVPKGWIKGTGAYKIIEVTSKDSVLRHIDKGTKMLQCTTAGTIAFPSKQAYGTWEFDWYKGVDGNSSYFQFVSSNNPSNGYTMFIYLNEQIYLSRYTNGSPAQTLCSTLSSYISNTTYYRIRITRTKAGVFTVLIKGGAFTPTAGYNGWTLVSTSGGSGTNPVTDTTYTTSNYFVCDLDAGDRIGNIVIKNSILV